VAALPDFFHEWGDAASVVSLFITLVGFTLTLRGQWKIRQVAKETVKRVAIQLAAADVGNLLRLVTDAREAGRSAAWARAIDRCQDARLIAIPMIESPFLTGEEKTALRRASEDLRIMIQYLENNRLPPGSSPANLPDAKKRVLDRMVAAFGGIKGRLLHLALEA
jgi:hypothetical protein